MTRPALRRAITLLLSLCLLLNMAPVLAEQTQAVEFGDMSFALLNDALWMTGTLSGTSGAVGVVLYAYTQGGEPNEPVKDGSGSFIHAIDPETGRYMVDCPVETDENGIVLSEYLLYAVSLEENAPAQADKQVVEDVALQTCTLSYGGMTLEALKESAQAYALQYGLIEGEPLESALPDITPEATPTPDPTPTPEATPATTPVPTPVPLTEDTARTLAIQVIQLSLDQARTEQFFAMPEAIEAYLLANLQVLGADGDYRFAVSLPALDTWALTGISKYKGSNPNEYLAVLAQAAIDAFAALPTQDDAIEGALTPVMPASDAGLCEALVSLGQNMEAWVNKTLLNRDAYPAMTRLALDQGSKAALWKKVDLADKDTLPIFATETKLKTLKRGSKGAAVRAVQQALVDQGYLTDRVDGAYGRNTEAAALAFEQAHGLKADGSLTHDEQVLLLGIPGPYYLSKVILEDAGWGDLLDAWWEEYLQVIQDVRWEGSVLTFQSPNLDALTPSLLDQLKADYMDNAFTPDKTASWLTRTLGKLDIPQATVVVPLCLEAMLDTSPSPILATKDQSALADAFAAYAGTIVSTLGAMEDYTILQPQPLAMPKTAVITKPSGSNSEFEIQNESDLPVYVRLYAVENAADESIDSLVGEIFVRAQGQIKLKLDAGFYHIHYATGEHWYGDEALFGDAGWYYCRRESFEFVKGNWQMLLLESNDGSGEGASFQAIGQNEV